MATNVDLGEIAFTGEYDVITDSEISQLPLEVQRSIENGKNCKTADSINILVTGKTGSGKSTLVSGILGFKVEDKSEGQVSKHEINREGITVRVWDSPGLQDGTGNQEDYLKQIKQQCSYRDLTIYCIRISDTRFVHTAENPDVVAMKKLTQAFGKGFWSNCIIALTYANTLTAMDLDWDTFPVAEQVRRFERKINEWREQVQDILVQDIGISRDTVKTITIAPVGHYRKPHLPGCEYWLSNFWFKCVVTISTLEVRCALVKINRNRIKRENEVKKSDFGMSPEMQPIVATKGTIPIPQIIGAGVAGGAIGSTVVGLISLVAGPAALFVSIPVGFIIGALIGGGLTLKR
ncbi:uncharacterized protein LOC135337849 [Halichondria panicea]|uniref:uncharacterized protein LOC135337849 n=1 Tax=Halichondria panicea TaxID=6063 RepID=UPI00312BB9B1